MTFIVTLIALLIERFFDWSHLRHWNWFALLQCRIMERIPNVSPYAVLACTIIPLLLAVEIVQLLLNDTLYGFPQLIFQVVVLLYCFGPKNLWADAYACINAMLQGDAKFASEKLKASFGITETSYSQSLRRHLLNDIFIEANRRIFAIVFWFVVLGPIGAVLYRAVTLSFPDVSKQHASVELAQSARSVESVLDWVPVRIFTFIFALGGHFVQVLTCWRKKALLGLSGNEVLLTECGVAALGFDDSSKLSDKGATERSAVSLLDRVFVIALVLVAIVVIVF